MITITNMGFPALLETKFLEWQRDSGRRKTISEFAAFLGVSQPTLSLWMNGTKKPGRENIKILADLFGPEIYDALELPRPNPLHEYITKHWGELPVEEQKRISEIVARYTTDPMPDGQKTEPSKP